MKFADYLVKQLTDIVEVYRRHIRKSYSVCLFLATILTILIAGLYEISSFSKLFLLPKTTRGIEQFIYGKFSSQDGYCPVDTAKMILLFFASIFSLSLFETDRAIADGKDSPPVNVEFSFPQTTNLFFTLIVSIIIDYGLSKAYWFIGEIGGLYSYWAMEIIFEIRTFVPYFLFAFALYYIKNKTYPTLNLKMIGFLFITFGLFNQVSLNIITYYRIILGDVITAPFNSQTTFIVQSFLSIPVIAFWFLGLYSVLFNSLQIIEPQQVLQIGNPENASDDEVSDN